MENLNQSLSNNSDIKQKKMEECFAKIDKLFITKESKTILKKIIDYMRQYSEDKEPDYASFNIQLAMNNSESLETIVNMLTQAMIIYNYCLNNKHVEVSMYSIEKDKQLRALYEEQFALIYINDLTGFAIKSEEYKQSFSQTFMELVKEYDKTITILGATKKDELNNFFASMKQFGDNYFEFIIEGVEPTMEEACDEIIEVASRSVEMTDDMKKQIKEYVANTYPNTELSFPEYRKSICKEIAFNKGVPSYERERALEEIFAELNDLVGLSKAKKTLREIVDLSSLKGEASDGFKIKESKLNMVFLGNYGTGKGTFAKYVTEILFTLKHIRHNKLI